MLSDAIRPLATSTHPRSRVSTAELGVGVRRHTRTLEGVDRTLDVGQERAQHGGIQAGSGELAGLAGLTAGAGVGAATVWAAICWTGAFVAGAGLLATGVGVGLTVAATFTPAPSRVRRRVWASPFASRPRLLARSRRSS